MGRYLDFTEKLRNLQSKRFFARTPGAMLRRPFRDRRSFIFAVVSDISYIAESVASWEKQSGLEAMLVAICAILTVRKKRAQQQMYVSVSLLNNQKLYTPSDRA